jgi:hypothetical protein
MRACQLSAGTSLTLIPSAMPPSSLQLRRAATGGDLRGTLAAAGRQLSAEMRARNLPSPGLALRTAAGWGAVTVLALYFQVQPSMATMRRKWRGEEAEEEH